MDYNTMPSAMITCPLSVYCKHCVPDIHIWTQATIIQINLPILPLRFERGCRLKYVELRNAVLT